MGVGRESRSTSIACFNLNRIGSRMSAASQAVARTALVAMYRTGSHRLLAPITRGLGAILMLHSVSPAPQPAFAPNGGLRVTPEFLDRTIRLVRSEGYDTVSLDEAHRRLSAPNTPKPFVSFTLDDGYRDNLEHAYPVFQRHNVPFCIYVPTSFADGHADLWWTKLEMALAAGRTLRLELNGLTRVLQCSNVAQQYRAWDAIYWNLRTLDEQAMRAAVQGLCDQAGVDTGGLAAREIMTWDEVTALARDPLCTIGAHTVNHTAVAKLPEAQAREEMLRSKIGLEERLGKPVRHFSYPYGSEADAGPRDFALTSGLGFATAVTTRKGLLFPEHREHMTALPRLSLNGKVQDERMLAVLLGGAPFALRNRFRRVSAA